MCENFKMYSVFSSFIVSSIKNEEIFFQYCKTVTCLNKEAAYIIDKQNSDIHLPCFAVE